MTTDTLPTAATASIPTTHASRYLQQLCKHFAHKIPVEFTPTDGSITFTIGTATLHADDAHLRIAVQAAAPADLDPLKDVVVRHLVRFAFREELAVEWQ